MENLGPNVHLHFSAFHPDWKMIDLPATPDHTLTMARDIAIKNGLHYVYTGNVQDKAGQSTYCANCNEVLIGRDWYELSDWNIDEDSTCRFCKHEVDGVFEKQPDQWPRWLFRQRFFPSPRSLRPLCASA